MKIYCQDALYSQVNHHQLFINPAYTGNSLYPRLIIGYRNQWPGMENPFVSYYVSYDQYVKSIASNLGISINRDLQGDQTISRTSGDFFYSYPVELSENSIISLGIQAAIVQRKTNTANLQLTDPSEMIQSHSRIFPDFGVGAAIYIKEQYLFSFAVHHINSPQETENLTYNYSTPMQINIQALAEFSFNKPYRSINQISLLPGIYALLQNNYNFITTGCNLKFNNLYSGLWLRSNSSFSLNTIIVQLGYTLKGLSFFYSYDAWAPKNYQHFQFYGAHEVTFINYFKYNDPKKKMKTIKCPKI